jgi:hypothetical protein
MVKSNPKRESKIYHTICKLGLQSIMNTDKLAPKFLRRSKQSK